MVESLCLDLWIRIHGGRFHGMNGAADEWPPSPGRVFQALVAAASRGQTIREKARDALRWLETLVPPTVAAPHMTRGQAIDLFVPNNDLDAVGGRVERIGDIRTQKHVAPKIFDEEQPFLYSWRFDGDPLHAETVCAIARDLYQLGRGVDQAWADPRIHTVEGRASQLAEYRGEIYEASGAGDGIPLSCPTVGTLASLEARFEGGLRRITRVGRVQQFVQPPKPRLLQVSYGSSAARYMFDLLRGDQSFATQPMHRAAHLVELVRNLAAERLASALPDQRELVESFVIGRSAGDANRPNPALRIRILALPSIGHAFADRGIRRIVVEIPTHCPLRADDVRWAFSGLELYDPDTGVVHGVTLTPAEDSEMLSHFGFGKLNSRWQSVTPLVLPENAKRRRIEPTRMLEEAKAGAERVAEEQRAVRAGLSALRQAGIHERVAVLRVQREPFARKGTRAEAFAGGTRFAKERLWHVELEFEEQVPGPLVIGDGRFLGLGLFAPEPPPEGSCEPSHVFALAIEDGLEDGADAEELARALRRAMLARMQRVIGRGRLSPFLTGHNASGEPTTKLHLGFAFDPKGRRLLVVAPNVRGRDRDHLKTVETALQGFDDLRAGSAGRLRLRSTTVDISADPLMAPSTQWTTVTPYDVTRHGRAGAIQSVIDDVLGECHRAQLPVPVVDARDVRGVPGRGLRGAVRLTFATAVRGPITLGRTRFLGGGLFLGSATAK